MSVQLGATCDEFSDDLDNSDEMIGEGKWVIVRTDNHFLRNGLIFVIQRIAHLDTGQIPGNRELWHTTKTTEFEWVKLSDPRYGYHSSGMRMYGSTFEITQTYLPLLLANGGYKMRWVPDLKEVLP